MEGKAFSGTNASTQVGPCRAETDSNQSRKIFAVRCDNVCWTSKNYVANQFCNSSVALSGQRQSLISSIAECLNLDGNLRLDLRQCQLSPIPVVRRPLKASFQRTENSQ